VNFLRLAILNSADFNLHEPQAFIDTGQILLVSRDTVKGFCNHHIELAAARIAHQLFPAKPVDGRGARNCSIVILGYDGELVAFTICPAECYLIVNRPLTLFVRAKSGVNSSSINPNCHGPGPAPPFDAYVPPLHPPWQVRAQSCALFPPIPYDYGQQPSAFGRDPESLRQGPLFLKKALRRR
jgi:hypothetical protein